MVEGQHLYPIRRSEQQKAISQVKTEQKTYHHKPKEQKQERKTHVFYHENEILMMLGLIKSEDPFDNFDLKECDRDMFVCTIKGAVHSLFHKLLQLGKLYNSNVRTDDNKIVQFNIGDITIQENPTFKDVCLTIDKLKFMLTPE